MLEITIKLDSMAYYSRRNQAKGGSGIGAWLTIMEFIAIICIPVNVSIMIWTGNK